MREILFKAKRKDNGDWIEGFLTICDERYFIVENGKVGCLCFDTLPKGHYVFMPYIEVDQSTVSQFTGLTDKNGKKIFEGDIIEWFLPEVSEYPSVAYIEYDEESFAWRVCWKKYDPDWLEGMQSQYITVIGNIFDNKDLLS